MDAQKISQKASKQAKSPVPTSERNFRRGLERLGLALALTSTSVLLLGNAPLKDVGAQIARSTPFKNWGLINTKARSHINAVEAWKLSEGSSDVLVAVIDTGVDPNHKDLAKNIWRDPKRTDRAIFGWNFVNDTPNPIDDNDHGTHVSGIIGAVADLRAGVSGVAHHVSIMAVKYYADFNSGPVNLKNTVRAINYAVENGARVINYSGGGPQFSEDEYLALKKAEAKGILVVTAAGNEHQNTDLTDNYYYPAAYRLSNTISVAATDIRNQLLPSSNWGRKGVDVAAPGENIYSTLPGGRYGYMTGTSQATAFVTGTAALLLAKNPKLTPKQIKEIIMTSVDRVPALDGKIATGGRINAYSALLALRRKGQFDRNRTARATEDASPLMNLLALGE